MNAITFGTKRAFHGFLRVTRKPLLSLGLTAARFDLMYALLLYGDEEPDGPWQSELRKTLGVTAPVVTRMVKALEALGLVRRVRLDYEDRRQVRVRLTDDGKRCIVQARRAMIRAVRRIVHVAICFGLHRIAGRRLWNTAILDSYLCVLRSEFGDTARLDYPWGHPDD